MFHRKIKNINLKKPLIGSYNKLQTINVESILQIKLKFKFLVEKSSWVVVWNNL
jgi:hypothetical protein